jgi:hypothetical protein
MFGHECVKSLDDVTAPRAASKCQGGFAGTRCDRCAETFLSAIAIAVAVIFRM